jgi:hypothetical protein
MGTGDGVDNDCLEDDGVAGVTPRDEGSAERVTGSVTLGLRKEVELFENLRRLLRETGFVDFFATEGVAEDDEEDPPALDWRGARAKV